MPIVTLKTEASLCFPSIELAIFFVMSDLLEGAKITPQLHPESLLCFFDFSFLPCSENCFCSLLIFTKGSGKGAAVEQRKQAFLSNNLFPIHVHRVSRRDITIC